MQEITTQLNENILIIMLVELNHIHPFYSTHAAFSRFPIFDR